MPVSKVTKKLNLKKYPDWDKVADKDVVKKQIGDFVVKKILDNTATLQSSVAGNQYWKKGLSKKYAKEKGKIKPPVADMDLTGSMLTSLRHQSRSANVVEVGIFAYKQAQKADNHNKFSNESLKTAVPKRQFIPRDDQNFKRDIESGIKKIIKESVENGR